MRKPLSLLADIGRPAGVLAVGAFLTACAQDPVPEAQASPPTEGRAQKEIVIDGTRYFLREAPCCDRFNALVDERGAYVCSPTGGFSGRGKGDCPPKIEAAFRPPRSADR